MANTQEKRKIDFKYNFKIYFNLLKRYKFLFLGTLLVILIVESTYLVDKLLFKILVDRGTEFVNETLELSGFIEILLMIVVVFGFILVVRSVGNLLKIHLVNRLDSGIMYDLGRMFFNHLIQLSYKFHTSSKTGSLISRLIRGTRGVERMTDLLVFNLSPLIFQLIIVTGSLFYFSIEPAIVVLCTVVLFIGYSLFINHIQQGANLRVNEREDIEKANVSDVFTNIDSIKYFGKESKIRNRYARLSKKTKNARLRHWNYYRWLDFGHTLIIGVGTLLLMYFPIVQFLEGELTLGTLVFIFTVYGNLMGPLFSFVWGVRNFYGSMADFEDLFQYGKVENDIKDKKNARELKVKQGTIEFRNVSFKYKKRKIFSNFNLKINKNKKVAFVGSSGSGKTTLVKLLYRLYDVDEGEILIDGKNIKNFEQESLRGELSIVPQECVLFDDTIYTNILFSNPQASREDVLKAMKFAQLDKVVKEFPSGDKTIVGERGVKLSGGEKQRVSIARAILADKKILVLDEATSALDSETEHEIQKDLERLMKGRTSIIIAHRLSTIMKADAIVVLDKGRIVQIGKHNKLIREKGVYKRLWNLQKGGYIK